MNALFALCIALSILSAGPAFGHAPAETAKADVGLEEKLGQKVAADAVFTDENGNRVKLADLLDRPAIIAPVYLGCMHECPLLLTGLAQVLGRIDAAKPGRDYRVIAVSFDEYDTPRIAREKKDAYLKAVGRPFPGDAWHFLTGGSTDIRKFTDSIGFKFQRDGRDFSHPVALIVTAPGGTIVRYMEGVSFLPFEVTMALSEAAEGRVGSATRRVLMYCFSYDPLKKSYVFNTLRITMTAMVLFVGSFLAWLLISSKKGS